MILQIPPSAHETVALLRVVNTLTCLQKIQINKYCIRSQEKLAQCIKQSVICKECCLVPLLSFPKISAIFLSFGAFARAVSREIEVVFNADVHSE